MTINSFRGDYRWLSNFWPCRVEYEGMIYPSTEAAFQAAKTLDLNQRKRFTKMTDPSLSKREGRKLKLRSDWESVKVQVMFDVCKSKFEDPELREALLETWPRHLEEGNTHGDKVWGTVAGVGSNHLGKVLMRVREACRND